MCVPQEKGLLRAVLRAVLNLLFKNMPLYPAGLSDETERDTHGDSGLALPSPPSPKSLVRSAFSLTPAAGW